MIKQSLNKLHDIVNHGTCPETDFPESYIGETYIISERVKDHAGKDVHSHLFKHAVESGHEILDFTKCFIQKESWNNTSKRKTVEALLIKEMKPTLNRQDRSIALKLFN